MSKYIYIVLLLLAASCSGRTYVLDFGKHAFPAEAFGMNPATPPGDSYAVNNIYEGDGYIFVDAHGFKDDTGVPLIFDKENLSKGFSATDPDGKPGLFIDGVRFTPCYIRDNRLVGYITALDLVDNAGPITNPRLKTIAASLKEDSNPVIAVVKLKK